MLPIAALLLQLAQPPELPPAVSDQVIELRNAIGQADLALMRAEVCTAGRPGYLAEVDAARARHIAISNLAVDLYGLRRMMNFDGVDPPIPCRRADRARYLRDAKAAVSRAGGILDSQVTGRPGLWVGSFHLCRDTVEMRTVEDVDGSVRPIFRFAPHLREAIRAETESRIGWPMGVYVDGRLVAAPNVMEPISAEMQINGAGDSGSLERMRAAALLPC